MGAQPSFSLATSPDVKAHSARLQATSRAFLKDVPISEIHSATSVHMFSKHYALRHSIRSAVALGSAVLSSILDPDPKLPSPWDTAWKSSEVEHPKGTLFKDEGNVTYPVQHL